MRPSKPHASHVIVLPIQAILRSISLRTREPGDDCCHDSIRSKTGERATAISKMPQRRRDLDYSGNTPIQLEHSLFRTQGNARKTKIVFAGCNIGRFPSPTPPHLPHLIRMDLGGGAGAHIAVSGLGPFQGPLRAGTPAVTVPISAWPSTHAATPQE